MSSHYKAGELPEAWELIEALQASWPPEIRYHAGNVFKYIYRLGRKQGAGVESDLLKIADYALRAFEVLDRG